MLAAKFGIEETPSTTMVDQLSSFASEVTAWARESDGRTLGVRAEVRGVAGVWKDLTDSLTPWPAT